MHFKVGKTWKLYIMNKRCHNNSLPRTLTSKDINGKESKDKGPIALFTDEA